MGFFWVALGVLWEAVGALWVPSHLPPLPHAASIQIKNYFFRFLKACRQNQASGNTRRQRWERPERRKWCQKRWLGAHLPRTPGARMTVVTQTPSNESYGGLRTTIRRRISIRIFLDRSQLQLRPRLHQKSRKSKSRLLIWARRGGVSEEFSRRCNSTVKFS